MAAPVGGVWAMKSGDFQPTNFASTQSGIQAALDYCNAPGGEVYIGPGSYTNLTNFTVYGKTRIRGAGPLTTELRRASSATGTMFREKTAGEGNASGAAGIVMENMILYGNSTGDGINFGNQGGAQFTSQASLKHIHVRDFTGGTGITLNANTINCEDVWSIVNQNGVSLSGGGYNKFHGMWIEGNSGTGLYTNEAGDKFYGLHIEENTAAVTTGPSIRLASDGAGAQFNEFFGVDILVQLNRTNLITLASGLSANSFYGLNVYTYGATWTNTYYSDAYGAILDSTYKYVQYFSDPGSNVGAAAVWRNQSTNRTTKIVGATITTGDAVIGRRYALTDAATIAVDASTSNLFSVQLGGNRTMGVPSNASTGQTITFQIYQDGTGGRTLVFSNAAGGYKSGWSDTGNTANKVSTISFTYDGTSWNQNGAQSPYVS